jgi:S-DNA-T family DNA segregation ATPase FtsK/SpoIIIE
MAKGKSKKSGKLFGIKDEDLSLPEFSIPQVKPVSISTETKKTIGGVLLIVLTLILVLGPFGQAGTFGKSLYHKLANVFGISYPLIPIFTGILGFKLAFRKPIHFKILPSILGFVSLFVFLALLNILGPVVHMGGSAGDVLALPLTNSIGVITGGVLLAGILIASLLILSDTGHVKLPNGETRPSWLHLPSFSFFKRNRDDVNEDEEEYEEETEDEIEEEEESLNDEMQAVLNPKKLAPVQNEKPREVKVTGMEKVSAADFEVKVHKRSTYTPPPITLLETDKGKPNVGDIKTNSNVIKRTLANFGINVEMDEITVGPTVTRYALKPAQGVKLTRIVALQQDLALALAAHPIRIEAPIPGKSLVGIEIPNKTKSMVGLASLFADDNFANGKKPLLVALGRGLSGKSVVANLAKMPHALIAGTTGSGKSVTIHTLITSLLYRNGPDALRFIFVDPKRVELTLYNGIPHLLSPVITQPKQAIMALKWAAKEMDRRYDILEECKVRDIESYHNTVAKSIDKEGIDSMPYIVIVIDELADLMQAYPRELESCIVRLAQMSRAVGIHLVLSTQRPSVEVITGLIKANIPTRVALQVASQIDSRTILDQPGAEKLLGRGDMLYLSSESPQPERLQSAFISEEEVKSVVSYLVNAFKDELPDEVNFAGTNSNGSTTDIFSASVDGNDGGDDDDMYELAKMEVISAGKASTSYLQRKLKLGYARAARLIDMLEDRGIIGPGDGAKPREVLVGKEEASQIELE